MDAAGVCSAQALDVHGRDCHPGTLCCEMLLQGGGEYSLSAALLGNVDEQQHLYR